MTPGAPGVGFSLAPDRETLDRCAPVLAVCDYGEVLPEGLVHPRDVGLRTNGLFDQVRELQQRHGLPLVAHGTGLSVCGSHPFDAPRLARWLDRAAHLREALGLRWYTDHAGITAPAGLHVTLPVAVPFVQGSVAAGRARLDALARAVGVPVGVENSVVYAPLADPAGEPAFLSALVADDHALLLDVHNLWVHACNFGLDLEAWLLRAPLHRVIEVHVSGGKACDPAWVRGEPWRLDGHDTPVPEPVWALLDRVLPDLPALRGVTLERLEGTVRPEDVAGLVDEVHRIRAAVARRVMRPARAPAPLPEPPPGDPAELALADVWTARDPAVALAALAQDPATPPSLREAVEWASSYPDGVGLVRRIVLRLRFDRLLNGSARAAGWFEAEPAAFAAAFVRYAAEVPPTAGLPGDEAALFDGWR